MKNGSVLTLKYEHGINPKGYKTMRKNKQMVNRSTTNYASAQFLESDENEY